MIIRLNSTWPHPNQKTNQFCLQKGDNLHLITFTSTHGAAKTTSKTSKTTLESCVRANKTTVEPERQGKLSCLLCQRV